MRIILLIPLLSVLSCGSGDPFYRYSRREDLCRIPLIKPYEATNVLASGDKKYREDFKDWWVEFKYLTDSSVQGYYGAMADSLNVTNGIIYGNLIDGLGKPEGWWVVIPSEKVEKLFMDNHAAWKAYLQKRGITPELQKEPWVLFDEFNQYRTLPWYHHEQKITP